MPQDDDDAANRFLPRIREELDKLPLNDKQKDQVAPTILRHAKFVDDRSGALKVGSGFFDFAAKISDVVKRFREDGLTTKSFLRAAVQAPELFCRTPETIESHIAGVVDRFAADGLTRTAYLKAALKEPALFGQLPETVEANITGMVDRFASEGLTRKAYLCAALSRPRLFGQSPDTIASHITGVVDHFAAEGLTRTAYLNAALKQPPLFTQSPETVVTRIMTVADRFTADGLTVNEYLRAALKQPPLFYRSPETISRNIETIYRLFDDGIFIPPRSNTNGETSPTNASRYKPVIDFLLKRPALLGLADDNFALREVHQNMADGPTDSNLLTRPRHAAERELMRHLGHDDPEQPVPDDGFVAGQANPSEEQAKRLVLRALMHAGLIKGGSMER